MYSYLVDRNVAPSPVEEGTFNVCRNVKTRGVALGPSAVVFDFFLFLGIDDGIPVVVEEPDLDSS